MDFLSETLCGENSCTVYLSFKASTNSFSLPSLYNRSPCMQTHSLVSLQNYFYSTFPLTHSVILTWLVAELVDSVLACISWVGLSPAAGGVVLVLLAESEATLPDVWPRASLLTVSCVSGFTIASGLRSRFCIGAACRINGESGSLWLSQSESWSDLKIFYGNIFLPIDFTLIFFSQ